VSGGRHGRRRPGAPARDHPGGLAAHGDLARDLAEVGGGCEVGTGPGEVPGYQLQASALLWVAGDGSLGFHDPIRLPRLPEGGAHTNPFFVEFYQSQGASVANAHLAPDSLNQM